MGQWWIACAFLMMYLISDASLGYDSGACRVTDWRLQQKQLTIIRSLTPDLLAKSLLPVLSRPLVKRITKLGFTGLKLTSADMWQIWLIACILQTQADREIRFSCSFFQSMTKKWKSLHAHTLLCSRMHECVKGAHTPWSLALLAGAIRCIKNIGDVIF